MYLCSNTPENIAARQIIENQYLWGTSVCLDLSTLTNIKNIKIKYVTMLYMEPCYNF